MARGAGCEARRKGKPATVDLHGDRARWMLEQTGQSAAPWPTRCRTGRRAWQIRGTGGLARLSGAQPSVPLPAPERRYNSRLRAGEKTSSWVCVLVAGGERNANAGAPLAPTTYEHGALPASGDRDLWFHARAEGAGCRGPGLACVGLGARTRRTFGRCLHLGSRRRQEGWAISSRLFVALARRSMTHCWRTL